MMCQDKHLRMYPGGMGMHPGGMGMHPGHRGMSMHPGGMGMQVCHCGMHHGYCDCGCHGGFARHLMTKQEKMEKLREYQQQLELELQAVKEHIELLKS